MEKVLNKRIWRLRTIIYRAEASPDDPRKCWIRREEKHAMRTLVSVELMEKPAMYPALILTLGSIKAGFYITRENETSPSVGATEKDNEPC
jgi:hypothetical protein